MYFKFYFLISKDVAENNRIPSIQMIERLIKVCDWKHSSGIQRYTLGKIEKKN